MAVSHETVRGGDGCDDDADFRATLLRYNLQNNNEEPDEELGVDEVDAGRLSLLEFIKSADLRMTKKSLKKVLDQTGSDSSEAVNKLHPSDGTACGDVAVLHRLVIGKYTHQVELVTTLLTFTMANINLTTSTGKTAFQLAVESDNVEMVKALAALGADVNLCTTCTRNGRELSEHHLPTEIESQLDSWAVYEYVDGGKTSVHNEYSPSMRTLLEEVGAMTPHTKETHHHFLTKVPTRQRLQTRIDSEGQQKRGARVLCLDGGGARGLIQLEILRQLEEKLGGKIIDKFDYIIGSSAGGIIALALVYGNLPVWRLQRLYFEMDKEVFVKSHLKLLKGDTGKLESILKLWFRGEENYDIRMDEKKHPKCPNVLISATNWKTTHVKLHWFSNFLNDEYSKEKVCDVARYTSAAPTYFTSKDNYVDGGLLANNPSLHGLTTIQTHLRSTGQSAGVSLVVSVGTGTNPAREYGNLEMTNYIDYMFKNKKFLEFLVDVGQSQSVLCEASCRCMCTEQDIKYVRLNPLLVTEVDPEETDNQKLLDMLWTTRTYLHHNTDLDQLKQFFTHYTD